MQNFVDGGAGNQFPYTQIKIRFTFRHLQILLTEMSQKGEGYLNALNPNAYSFSVQGVKEKCVKICQTHKNFKIKQRFKNM